MCSMSGVGSKRGRHGGHWGAAEGILPRQKYTVAERMDHPLIVWTAAAMSACLGASTLS